MARIASAVAHVEGGLPANVCLWHKAEELPANVRSARAADVLTCKNELKQRPHTFTFLASHHHCSACPLFPQ